MKKLFNGAPDAARICLTVAAAILLALAASGAQAAGGETDAARAVRLCGQHGPVIAFAWTAEHDRFFAQCAGGIVLVDRPAK